MTHGPRLVGVGPMTCELRAMRVTTQAGTGTVWVVSMMRCLQTVIAASSLLTRVSLLLLMSSTPNKRCLRQTEACFCENLSKPLETWKMFDVCSSCGFVGAFLLTPTKTDYQISIDRVKPCHLTTKHS